jgi:hypothetical protein
MAQPSFGGIIVVFRGSLQHLIALHIVPLFAIPRPGQMRVLIIKIMPR